MKAFDEKFPREICSTDSDQNIVDFWREKQRKGWSAALGWVKSISTQEYNVYGVPQDSYYYWMSDLDEELEQ